MEECVLNVKGVTKYFNVVKALDEADFSLKKGEVHAVLGINGAGKSTLIKVISGFCQQDSGEIFVRGERVQINSPEDAMRHGIATVYQDPQLIPMFTGYENIFLGVENTKNSIFGNINRKKMKQKANELLEKFSVNIDLEKPVYLMSNVEKEVVEILRALSTDMTILILDEPTSILTDKEKQSLFKIIHSLKSKGVSIVYITHHLEEINQVADRMTIYRNGKNVATLDMEKDGIQTEFIAEIMLGKKLDMLYPPKGEDSGQVLFEARGIMIENIIKDVSFKVTKGKILGIFGLMGSGIDELSKALFGAIPVADGELYIQGAKIDLKSPADAISHKIFLVPGDRKTEGNIAGNSIAFNISLSKLSKIKTNLGFVNVKKEKSSVTKIVDNLDIMTPSIYQDVNNLSGGNQQKVVIGKGFFSEANIYIFSDPTVGVDVGAKSGIYNVMRELSKVSGVIVISSDCEEVYGIADRVMVIHNGGVALEKEVHETDVHTMLVYAVSDNVKSNSAEGSQC